MAWYSEAMKTALGDRGSLKGKYVVKVTDATTGEVISTQEQENLIVNSTGHGYDLITRMLGGDPTYELTIDSAAIGTSGTAASASDTDLLASAFSGIEVVSVEYPTTGKVILTFFITDGQLANATYREFGIFSNGRLFARSVFGSPLTKGSNQNITIEYSLTFS